MIYLDHAATSPLCDEARAAMEPYLTERFGNASEPHAAGRAAREGLQAARATRPHRADAFRIRGDSPRDRHGFAQKMRTAGMKRFDRIPADPNALFMR